MSKIHPELAVETAACIAACDAAAEACARCALSCMNGDPVDTMVPCSRVAMDGAQICGTTGGMLARASRHARSMLLVCEEVCLGCADTFSSVPDDQCAVAAEACRACAEACRALRERGSYRLKLRAAA